MKNVILPIVIIGLSLIIINSFQHNQQQIAAQIEDPRSNDSLMYENSTYGIKFQSPSNWNKVEILTARTINIEFMSPESNTANKSRATIGISIERVTQNITTLDEYLITADKLLNRVFVGTVVLVSQPTTLGGIPAFEKVYTIRQSGIEREVSQTFAMYGNKVYIVTYVAPPETYFDYLPVLGKVVESFQITK